VNGPDPHLDDEQLGAEIAAFILGALEEDEAAALKAHLDRCATCRAEYQRLKVAAEALPLAVPQHPVPPELGARLMSTVSSEAQLLDAATPAPEPRPRARRLWRRIGGFGGLAFATATAAVLVIALALGGAFSSGGTSQQIFRGQVIGVPGGSVELRVRGGRGELVVSNLSQPPAGRIYQVWLQRDGRAPQPTDALFGVSHQGAAVVAVPGTLHGVARVMVTAEPRGGSQHPTRSPLIIVSPV
jgi:anti-sigma-K factor RskA